MQSVYNETSNTETNNWMW